jgi:hypothetical protein
MNRLRLVILCPEWGGPNDFWIGLHRIKGYGKLLDEGRISFQKAMYIQEARREAVRELLELQDWEMLVWFDYDHTFSPDVLQIFQHSGYAIHAGPYVSRRPPFPPVLYRYEHPNIRRLSEEEVSELEVSPRPVPVDVAGHGCMAVHRCVYEKWRRQMPDTPWYATPTTKEGEAMGEDVWFCIKARELGYRTYVDFRIPADHWMPYRVGFTHYHAQQGFERRQRVGATIPSGE